MPKLFDETQIKTLELSNRSVRSATWSGVGDEKGYVTERALDFYAELGRGGIGLIITGYQYVMRNGQQLPYMIGNYEDGQLEGLTRMAEAVHKAGGKVVPQIVHCGVGANPKVIPKESEVWGPSAVKNEFTGKVAKEVTKREIQLLIEAYAAAAERCAKAGFDGVQLHGAHGYGINQFLSPRTNTRGDTYGGSLQNRYRFLAETMEAVRGAVGDDFPVLIKLSVDDHMEGGLGADEGVEVACRLADDGIDAIEVSGGNPASPKNAGPARTKIKTEDDEAYFAGLAARVKEAVRVPVISVGGIRSLKKIDDMLSDRVADYVSMSRPFIREPHLMNRWKAGDTARAACISCNGCFETGYKGTGIWCKVERKLQEKQKKS